MNTIAVVLFFILLYAAGVALGGWILMLCLGAFAHVTGYMGFAISFWASYIAAFVLGLFIGGSNK